MSYYAFEDEERTKEMLAEKVDNDNKLDYYFCPTENCEARLSIRNMNGDGAAYFAANPSTPHSKFCRISHHARITHHDEGQFDFDNFINNLLIPNNPNNGNGAAKYGDGDGQIGPLTTVCQLYSVCIQKSINQFYNNMRISDLLIDRRTRHIYYLYIRGQHLIECQFWRYDRDNNLYDARYWLDDENDNYITIRLLCLNSDVYKKIFNRVFRKVFVVAGCWQMNNNSCETTIVNPRQVYALRD